MQKNSQKHPPHRIVITTFDGELVAELECAPRPKPPLWRRLKWRLHCWRTDIRNTVYWLRGGRW